MKRLPTQRWFFVVLILTSVMLLAGCEPFSSSSKDPDSSGNNDPNMVLALGDSVTAGSAISGLSYPQLVADFSGKTVINEGVGGALSSDGADRIQGLLETHKPEHVFILYGINDIIHVSSDDWTIENLRFMINAARNNKSSAIVGTIPPRYRGDDVFDHRHVSLNNRIRQLCLEESVTLADVESAFDYNLELLQEDGFHPNEDGNRLIALVFYEALP